jgi:hypothetical protein
LTPRHLQRPAERKIWRQRPNRINVDTGAFYGRVRTAAVFQIDAIARKVSEDKFQNPQVNPIPSTFVGDVAAADGAE